VERVSFVGRYDLEWLPQQAALVSGRTRRWSYIALLAVPALWMLEVVSLPMMVASAVGLLICGVGIEMLSAMRLSRLARDELRQLATNPEHLRLVGEVADDVLVRVRGRVKLREMGSGSGSSLEMPEGAVFVRVRGARRVHERAVDFSLVDERGEEIWIEVEGARLLHPSGNQWAMRDHTVRAGDVVEVIGWKDRRVDQRVTDRLGREEPMRATLRSGKTLPLLIVPMVNKELALGVAPPRLTDGG